MGGRKANHRDPGCRRQLLQARTRHNIRLYISDPVFQDNIQLEYTERRRLPFVTRRFQFDDKSIFPFSGVYFSFDLSLAIELILDSSTSMVINLANMVRNEAYRLPGSF